MRLVAESVRFGGFLICDALTNRTSDVLAVVLMKLTERQLDFGAVKLAQHHALPFDRNRLRLDGVLSVGASPRFDRPVCSGLGGRWTGNRKRGPEGGVSDRALALQSPDRCELRPDEARRRAFVRTSSAG